MKHPFLITLGTSTAIILGAVTLSPDKKQPDLLNPIKPEKPVIIALPPQAINGWLNSRGIHRNNVPHAFQGLLDEEPPTVDISQVSLKSVADEYRILLDLSDVRSGLRGKNANDIIKQKIEHGFARDKKEEDYVND